MRSLFSAVILTGLFASLLPAPVVYQGRLLYPYYCTKIWICDYVTEEVYRTHCQQRPCKTVR